MHRGFKLACLLLVGFFIHSEGLFGESLEDAVEVTSAARQGNAWRKLLEVPVKPPKNSTKGQIKNDNVKATTAEILTGKSRADADSKNPGKSKKKVRPVDEEEDEDLQFLQDVPEGKADGKSASAKNREAVAERTGDAVVPGKGPETKADKKSASNKGAVAGKSSDEEEIQIEEIPDVDDDESSHTAEEKQTDEVPEEGKRGVSSGKKPKQNKPKVSEESVDEERTSATSTASKKKIPEKKGAAADEDEHDDEDPEKNLVTVPLKKSSTSNTTKTKKESKLKKPKTEGVLEEKLTPKKNTTKKMADGKKTGEKMAAREKTGEGAKEKTKDAKQLPLPFPGAEDVEDLQTDAGLPKSDSLMGEDEEDEDFSFLDDFSSLPTKMQETAGHVAEKLRPGIQRISETTKGYISQANQQMTEHLTPLMGDQVAPVVAALISYGLLLVPLVVVLYVLERIRATLTLAKVLFFINLYLAAYFLTLVLARFALHGEPMAFFFKNSPSSYVFLQLLQAFGYCFYVLLYAVVLVKACSNEGVLQRILAGLQLVLVALFGLHYYIAVFHRAMASKAPRITWKIYTAYSVGFAVLCLVAKAKIEHTKKEYYYTPVDDPDEVIPIDKRS